MITESRRKTLLFTISDSQIAEAVARGRSQEKVFGHNTGHFTLAVEKENTIIGVLGEIVVRDLLVEMLSKFSGVSGARLCEKGDQFDIELFHQDTKKYIHVKSGLWKRWPQDIWEFGIHADQGIADSGSPLVLVTFIKADHDWPRIGRIEGYVSSHQLKNSKVIKSGERFPSTGVMSRTDNLLTHFSEYLDFTTIFSALRSANVHRDLRQIDES